MKSLSLSLSVALIGLFLSFPALAETELSLSANPAGAGQNVIVTLKGLPGNAQDWVSLARKDQADNQYLQYTYLQGATDSTWSFRAPAPGDYEVRLYLDWPNGGYNPVQRQDLKVISAAEAADAGVIDLPEVKLAAKTFAPNQAIEVSVSKLPGNRRDWVAIAKAGSADDSYIDYDYTNAAAAGTWTYSVREPGDYEIRVYLNWPDGGYNPVVRVPVTVAAGATPAPAAAPGVTEAPVATPAPATGDVPFGSADSLETLISVLAKTRAEAQAILGQAGYAFLDERSCLFRSEAGGIRRDITLQVRPRCQDPAAEVIRVDAREFLPGRGVNPDAEIAAIERVLGPTIGCVQGIPNGKRCSWNRSDARPTLKQLQVQVYGYPAGSGGKDRRQYWLDAWSKRDEQLQAQRTAGNNDPLTDWTNRQNQARQQQLEAGGRVTAAEIEQEAVRVVEYCKSQSMYAVLNDCDCIGEAFIPLRQKEPWKKLDPIQVANKIPDTACPNGDGIYTHYYNQCGEQYMRQIASPGLEAFCACYGEEVKARYLKQPATSSGYVARLGGAATRACDQRGLPSPLNPNRPYDGPVVTDTGTKPDARGFLPLPEGFCRLESGVRFGPKLDRYRACQAAKDPESYTNQGYAMNRDYYLCLWTRLAGDNVNGDRVKQGCEKDYGPGQVRVTN